MCSTKQWEQKNKTKKPATHVDAMLSQFWEAESECVMEKLPLAAKFKDDSSKFLRLAGSPTLRRQAQPPNSCSPPSLVSRNSLNQAITRDHPAPPHIPPPPLFLPDAQTHVKCHITSAEKRWTGIRWRFVKLPRYCSYAWLFVMTSHSKCLK